MTRSWIACVGGALLLSLWGCGGESVGKDGDVVGGSCAEGTCADGSECLTASMYPEGTCSVACSSQDDCPDGSTCVQESGGRCLLACSGDGDCRDGYSCIEKSTEPDGHGLVCLR